MGLILKFVFFVGWLEVSESIENPFGNDDDDFQIPELISRHVWAISRNFNQFRGPPTRRRTRRRWRRRRSTSSRCRWTYTRRPRWCRVIWERAEIILIF